MSNALWQGAVAALAGVAFTLLYRSARFLDFGFAAAALWAAYVAQQLVTVYGLGVFVASALAIACVAVSGAACHVFLYRSAAADDSRALPNLLASLGAYLVLQNGLLLWLGPRNVAFFNDPKWMDWRGSVAGRAGLFAIVVVTLVATGSSLQFTGLGLLMRAAGSNPRLASDWGLHVSRLLVGATGSAYALAGVVGIVMGIDTNLQPGMGFRVLMIAVVASIVGGVTSLSGAAFAGVALGVVTQVAAWYVGPEWSETILLLLFVAALLMRPAGILTAATEARHLGGG
jgi:branched-chain amino acid transport system permease protein